MFGPMYIGDLALFTVYPQAGFCEQVCAYHFVVCTRKNVNLISFFERTETEAADERKLWKFRSMIPGDRGKVERGWFARPL